MSGEDEIMSSSPVEIVMPDCPVMPNCPVNRPDYPECIGVFWDVVDFPFPKGLSPDMIYHKMKLFLHSLGCCGEMLIVAYVDKEQFDDKLVSAYQDAGIDIVPRLGDKHSRYRSTSLDTAMWELVMSEGDKEFYAKTLMVLSKEVEKESFFSTFLESMATPCHHVFVTLDHDPPPKSLLERVCFDLLLEDESETLLGSSDRKRKREEESICSDSHETMPSCPIIPDSPVISTFQKCSTHVFWDGVDFPLRYAYAGLQISLHAYGVPAASSLVAYVDEAVFCLETETETDGITFIPCQGDEEARSHAMLVDIVLWAMENPATYFEPITLMVVSKHIKQGTCFFNALEALNERHYNVILVEHLGLSLRMTIKSLDMEWPQFYTAMRSRSEMLERGVVGGFSNGLASLDRHGCFGSIAEAETMIFWDVQGCPADFSIVEQVLHKKGYHGNVIVRPYVDMNYGDDSFDTTPKHFIRFDTTPKHFIRFDTTPKYGDDSFDKTSTHIRFKSKIRVGSEGDAKYAKVTRMLLDIVFWAMNNDGMPKNLMLISKPSEHTTKCELVIQALERRGINIIFRPSDQLASVDDVGRFESLCKSPPVGAEKLINQSRILTDLSRELAWNEVIVFWLVDNCPSNPRKIWNNIQSALEKKGYLRIIPTFTAYVDQRNFSDEMRDVFRKARVVHKIISEEEDRVTTMLLDMIRWKRLRRPPNFLVISEPFTDPICDMVVEGLKRRGCNVLFELPDYMLTFGRSRWSAKSLLRAS